MTPRIKKKIIAKAFFMDKDFPFLHIRRFINKPRSIFMAYCGRRDVLISDDEFKRPPADIIETAQIALV